MPKPESLPPAGWYPDPYQHGSVRWYDGSKWTTHAVSADETRPDRVVEDEWGGHTGPHGQGDRFPQWDVAVARDGEPAFGGGGGAAGLDAARAARVARRYGMDGPISPARWLGAIAVVLALLAWGDHRHRVVLLVAAALVLGATVVVAIRTMRERAYWKNIGRSG